MHTPLHSQSTFLAKFFLLPMLLLYISASAQQAGELDTSFNTEDVGLQLGGFRPNSSGVVLATALQEDNKIIIGGRFVTYDGQTRNSIARLNEDGSLDVSFDPGTGFDSGVETIIVQSDGKILVGGTFRTFNGVSRPSIARLNADGSLDTSFDPGNGFNRQVQTLVVQADGKIIAGGEFTSYNGTECTYIARLNPDGTLDEGFGSGTGFNTGAVKEIVIQSDGKIIVGGSFRQYNGEDRSGIVRLNADGSLDTSFNPGHGVDGQIESLALQPDGKIIAGGMFFNFNSTYSKSMVRLNADGSRDPSFAVGIKFSEFNPIWIYSIVVQPDGKIIVAGDFLSFYQESGENAIFYIARLQEDGSVDKSFDTNLYFNSTIWTLSLQRDGKIVAGGNFTQFGATRDSICRLKSQGSIDPTFNYASGFDNLVNATAVQADGKIIVGGIFHSFSDQNCTRIARLHADGTLDTSFETGIGFNLDVRALAVQEDGKIIVAGTFDNYNGINRKNIVRLNPDGSLDSGFEAEAIYNGYPDGIILLPDGKIMVYSFIFSNGDIEKAIVRLNNDGSLDTGFSPGTEFSRGIKTAAVQADGKIVVGGNFENYKGMGLNHIVRLNADGSPDTEFNPGTGFSGPVNSLVIQEDGKIVVTGSFEKFNGTDRKRIARLNADGSLDTGFNPGNGFIGGFSAVALQSSGKLVLAGEFTSYDGTNRNRIVRINADGSLDRSFDPGTGFNSSIFSITIQPDENILLGGLFTSYNGTARNHMVRIYGGENGVTALPANTFNTEVLIYPNPFTSEISVKLPQIPFGQVQVFVKDIAGRAVYSETVIPTVGQDLSVKLDDHLPKGMYLLQLHDGQEIGSYRVIKE